MTIGTGIAVAGVWIGCAIVWQSKFVTGRGCLLATAVAIVLTICFK